MVQNQVLAGTVAVVDEERMQVIARNNLEETFRGQRAYESWWMV